MKHSLALLLLLVLFALGAAAGQESDGDPPVRFTYVDLWLDSGAAPLAAWQVELNDPSGRSRVVGIEGGEHPAFAEPAHYDPRALHGGRVILATFSLDAALPVGRTRVARVHLEVEGPGPVSMIVGVEAAAGPRGARLDPLAELVPREEAVEEPGEER